MAEDPLMRLEREQYDNKENSIKSLLYIFLAVIIVLGGALTYVWASKAKLIKQLNVEKDELTERIEALRKDYDSLSSDNENLNSQLDSSKEMVSQLVERIKKTDVVNRTKIRQYEKELGTLRKIMRNYLVQIDSLNTLNQKLTADAIEARKEVAKSKKENAALSQKVENLAGQVAVGSIVRARNISLQAYNASEKVTDRSSRVKRLLTNLCLVENKIAERGPLRVFIVIKDPDGLILTNNVKTSFFFNEKPMIASASREIDYQGKDLEMSIYLNSIPEFHKGIYRVEVFTEKAILGAAELMLR